MTSRIEQCFATLRERREVALIPFITAGDPDLATTAQALATLDAAGADVLELGVPYSDPLADGPVIQAAATRSLARGTSLSSVLALVQEVSPRLRAPLVLYTYFNPILSYGLEHFFERLQAVGASGLLIPDLPVEEGEKIRHIAQAHQIDIIWLVAPTSPPERMRKIVAQSSGFLYLVSTTGVTGMRAQIAASLGQTLGQLRTLTTQPVAVGFGISNTEQAHAVAELGADGVIVGSAFVQLLASTDPAERLEKLGSFCAALKQAAQRPVVKY